MNELRSPSPLALCRITVYLTLLFTYFWMFSGSLTAWSHAMPMAAWTPRGLMQILPAPNEESFSSLCLLLEVLFLASVTSAIVGFKWKMTSWSTLVLSLLVFGLRNSFGHAFRTEAVLILVQFGFVFAKASDALSLDSRGRAAAAPSHEYAWPLLVFRLTWVAMIFSSGLAKIRASGFHWVSDNYLRWFLISNQITRGSILEDRLGGNFAATLAMQPELCLAAGALVFIFELGYPLILTSRRVQIPMLLMTFIFQFSIYILMGVNFFMYFSLLPIWSTARIDGLLDRANRFILKL